MSSGKLDPYRTQIEGALAAGATKTAVARSLQVPRNTLRDSLDRWNRPAQGISPEARKALEELARMVK